jgi:NNP family nitrate/nitrite transporter-like MFS transporter
MRKHYKYVILAIICLCGFNSLYFQYQMSPIASEIMAQYNVSKIQYSTLFTAGMMPAIFISLLCGIIVDKAGAKRILFACLCLSALGLWVRVFADTYTVLYLCMMVQGFAATFINSTQAKLLGEWFTPGATSVCTGLYLASTAVGMTIGTATTGMLPSVKFAYATSAVIATCVAFIWLLFMKEKHGEQSDGQKIDRAIGRSLEVVFRDRNLIFACIAVLCVYGCYMVISSFLPAILSQIKGMSKIDAGSTASVVSIGYLIGCLTIPTIAAKLGKYRLFVSALVATGTVLTILINFANPGILLTTLLVLTGYTVGGIMPMFLSLPIRLRSIGVENAGTAGGLIATFMLAGAVIIPSYVVLPITDGDYTKVLLVGGIICAIACIATLLMNKNVEITDSKRLRDASTRATSANGRTSRTRS